MHLPWSWRSFRLETKRHIQCQGILRFEMFFSWHTSASSYMGNGDESWPMFWIGCSTQMTWHCCGNLPTMIRHESSSCTACDSCYSRATWVWNHKMNRCDWPAYHQTCCQPNKPNKCEWNWEVVDRKLLKDIFRDATAELPRTVMFSSFQHSWPCKLIVKDQNLWGNIWPLFQIFVSWCFMFCYMFLLSPLFVAPSMTSNYQHDWWLISTCRWDECHWPW